MLNERAEVNGRVVTVERTFHDGLRKCWKLQSFTETKSVPVVKKSGGTYSRPVINKAPRGGPTKVFRFLGYTFLHRLATSQPACICACKK